MSMVKAYVHSSRGRNMGGSRLWPVLLVLVGVVAGAATLEYIAEHRTIPPLRIVVAASDSLGDADDDGATQANVGTISEAHEHARMTARRGDVAAALTEFDALIEQHPNDVSLRIDRAFWLIRQGKSRVAVDELRATIELDDTQAAAHTNLGAALVRIGRMEDAEHEYRRAIELNPSSARARIALARLLVERGAFRDALRTVEPATRTGANAHRAHASVALGCAYLGQGVVVSAGQAFDQAIEWSPADADILLRIERCWRIHAGREGLDRAVSIAERAAALAPDVARVHTRLGRARERVGDRVGAQAAYLRSLALEPDGHYARRRLIRVAMALGDLELARRQSEQLLRQDSEDPEHHFLAGLVAVRDGDLEAGRAAYEVAITRSEGRYPEAFYNLGRLERRSGDIPAAIAAYQQAIEQRPDYLAAFNNLGLVLAHAERFDEALQTYRQAVELDGEYGPAWLNLGRLLSSLGLHDEARSALEQAIATRSGDYPRAQLALGVATSRAGDPALAAQIYLQLATAHPRYALAWHNLGEALSNSERHAEAIEAFRRAYELDPEHVSSLTRLGDVLVSQGRVADARDAYAEAVEREPGNTEARFGYARVLVRMGDRQCRRELRVLPNEARIAQVRAACRDIQP